MAYKSLGRHFQLKAAKTSGLTRLAMHQLSAVHYYLEGKDAKAHEQNIKLCLQFDSMEKDITKRNPEPTEYGKLLAQARQLNRKHGVWLTRNTINGINAFAAAAPYMREIVGKAIAHPQVQGPVKKYLQHRLLGKWLVLGKLPSESDSLLEALENEFVGQLEVPKNFRKYLRGDLIDEKFLSKELQKKGVKKTDADAVSYSLSKEALYYAALHHYARLSQKE